jgi:hypothetical protein
MTFKRGSTRFVGVNGEELDIAMLPHGSQKTVIGSGGRASVDRVVAGRSH